MTCAAPAVHRIEVRPQPGRPDARSDALSREAAAMGFAQANGSLRINSAAVYLICGRLSDAQVARLAEELLADPVTESATIGASRVRADSLVEVHPLPGVMDPAAEAVELAVKSMMGTDVQVRTGRRYDFHSLSENDSLEFARRCLANTLIHAIHTQPYHPSSFPAGAPGSVRTRTIALRGLDDPALARLSRDAHLFLSLEEMKAVRDEYRALGRDPREIELETIAQTWSEHCVHKTLKATIRYRERLDGHHGPRLTALVRQRPGHDLNPDGSITIHNLLKSTVAAATHRLIAEGIDWCLSVFVDNAGVIAFDDEQAVCFKCETHNHPSALEPYGGAATGIGGCIRDIMGTGLAARPIAATDVFCVAPPDVESIPSGVIHPRRVLAQVVAGVRDYGNRMGIPTLNGAVWFHDDYIGNPLVFCGCIGLMPRDKITGAAQPGDRIIALGGRTGRDGIHGATFSSAELTDTHADEFSHAVQIGNAITEKKLLDAILEARDAGGGCLYHAITDCGAGGFSSAVGEMGAKLGARVTLETAPLKYEGLTPTEIWISEAQERMVLAVAPDRVAALQAICDRHDVLLCDLGEFGTPGAELILTYAGEECGRVPMQFLHEGLPRVTREAAWTPIASRTVSVRDGEDSTGTTRPTSLGDALLALLAHPNIASKRWIIRQYDHEVQGASVIKPLVGPHGEGPSDAAVIQPVPGSQRGLAIANGLATGLCADPYVMTLAAIDECVRNLVCVGADPNRIAILDNFCWPGCDDPQSLGALVRAAEACHDGAIAYRTPFISGKDSLNNQFATEDGRTIRIPPTLLISGMGIVPDVRRCVSMDAKAAGNALILIGATDGRMGGSHFEMLQGSAGTIASMPEVDLEAGPRMAAAVAALISAGFVRSAHDCSDGGMLVAAVEMAMAGNLGLRIDLSGLTSADRLSEIAACFAETPSRYVLEIEPRHLEIVRTRLGTAPCEVIGEFNASRRVTVAASNLDLSLEQLQAAWLGALDW
jgi:phosphoribosylformylglycinamidine synthase